MYGHGPSSWWQKVWWQEWLCISLLSPQVLLGRKHCQWQCGSSCSSSVNWTFFLTMFLHFSEKNQPLRDIAMGTRLWLWGKCILGKFTHFELAHHVLSVCIAKPLSNTQTGQVKRSCSIFWLYFSSLILYLTSLASVSFACVGVGEPAFCCVLPFACAFYLYLRKLLFPQEDLEILAHWALNTCLCWSPWGTEAAAPCQCKGFLRQGLWGLRSNLWMALLKG